MNSIHKTFMLTGVVSPMLFLHRSIRRLLLTLPETFFPILDAVTFPGISIDVLLNKLKDWLVCRVLTQKVRGPEVRKQWCKWRVNFQQGERLALMA